MGPKKYTETKKKEEVQAVSPFLSPFPSYDVSVGAAAAVVEARRDKKEWKRRCEMETEAERSSSHDFSVSLSS